MKLIVKSFATVLFYGASKVFSIFRFETKTQQESFISSQKDRTISLTDSHHELQTKSKLIGEGYKEIPSHP